MSAVSQHPSMSAVSQHPSMSAVSQHPSMSAVSQHPSMSAVSQHPSMSAVSQHPSSLHRSERCSGRELWENAMQMQYKSARGFVRQRLLQVRHQPYWLCSIAMQSWLYCSHDL